MIGVFLLENILKGVHDDAFFLIAAQHGVGFAGGGLAVHEDGRVVALQELLDYFRAALGVDLTVALVVFEDVI